MHKSDSCFGEAECTVNAQQMHNRCLQTSCLHPLTITNSVFSHTICPFLRAFASLVSQCSLSGSTGRAAKRERRDSLHESVDSKTLT